MYINIFVQIVSNKVVIVIKIIIISIVEVYRCTEAKCTLAELPLLLVIICILHNSKDLTLDLAT